MLASLLLASCGVMDKVAPGRDKIDYKKSKAIDTLEVPPELSSSTINEAPEQLSAAQATLSDFGATQPARESTGVMPVSSDVRVERDGDQQWLVVKGSPEQLWPRVREFWLQEGFLLRLEDPQLGILETDWSENRADIPQGAIRKLIGKAIDAVYSAATRDKYRVRLERGSDAGTTEIYLTHRGVEEVIKGGATDVASTWQPRPSDPELEAEMIKRMLVFLGVEQQKAQTMLAQRTEPQVRAELLTDGSGSMLIIKEDYSRAWRRTGVALDRVGFTVQDRDRSSGTYYVKYNDPLGEQDKKGILNKLAFWSSDDDKDGDEYRIELQASGADTHAIVKNSKGERDTSPTAKRILTLLEEQLR
ncbi:MAG TPA: outer membrane protein assembly factor BamC [Gammaproteobacteria bacterium]|nr:outer membrane protein assembly factor BamC [Gammaproteobacteria bacterium]